MTKIRKVTEKDFYEAQENFSEWRDKYDIGGMCHYQNYNLGDEINISSVLIEKYLENLAVNKFFDKSNSEIIRNDVISYCNKSHLPIGRYGRMKAALKAIDRLGEDIIPVIEDFKNFREMVNFYIY